MLKLFALPDTSDRRPLPPAPSTALTRYTMLGTACDNCGTVLMRDRDGVEHCLAKNVRRAATAVVPDAFLPA